MPAWSPCLHLPSPGITGMPHHACHSLWFLSLPLFLLSWASPPLSFRALSFDLFCSSLLCLSCLTSISFLEILVTLINCLCVCIHEYAPAHVPPCMHECVSQSTTCRSQSSPTTWVPGTQPEFPACCHLHPGSPLICPSCFLLQVPSLPSISSFAVLPHSFDMLFYSPGWDFLCS